MGIIQKLKQTIQNKRGFMSIFIILWLAVLIPILIFVTVTLSQYMYDYSHLKDVTDNAAASAVTKINNSLVPQGILQIEEAPATATADAIIQHDLDLKSDWTPTTQSELSGAPSVQVYVVNSTNPSGYVLQTPAGAVTVYHPSVVVYAKYPVKGLFFNFTNINMQKVGVSQVQFGSPPQS